VAFLKLLFSAFCVSGFVSISLFAQSPLNLPAQVGATASAEPFTVAEKFDYRIVQTIGLRGLAGGVLGAAIGQGLDSPDEWGQGGAGFGKRYASSIAGNVTRQSMAFVLESTFHEDPRYFPSEEKGFKARVKNVLLQTVVARTDSQGNRFAYGRVISAFANAQLVNTWQPASTGSVGDGVMRGFTTLAGDLGVNCLQEFVPFLRPKALRH
jgi:hypothetical protein